MEPNNEKKENQATQPEPGAQLAPAQEVTPEGVTEQIPLLPPPAPGLVEATTETKPPEQPSAPEPPSEEVKEKKPEGPTFQDLFEKSIKQPDEGEIIRGTVVRVGKEHVMVDIGFKSEGQIEIAEFTDSKNQITIHPGDIIDVLVERREDENGIIHLSKEKADKVKVWEDLEKAHHSGMPVEGKIVSKVKGGMTVDIGVRAFLPGSQVDLRPTRNLDSFVGNTAKFKILKFNRKRGNVVVSRRMVLEDERANNRAETLKILEKGRILTGVIKNLVEYGAFIDLGGIDGLLHVTDMSWGRIKHPSDILQVGQEIKVVVLKFDPESERVSLGLKQITPDPWDSIEEKYAVGSKVLGKVVSTTDYGAFIELEPGVEGLVHVSEMSWTRRIRHPSKIVQVGQEVEIMILDVDISNRRISLGLKQVEPNPWDVVSQKYPPDTVIRGRIRNITDFGIFIGVSEGIDGLVHISDISWTKRIKHPSELYKKGHEVEAVVLNIDKENERFSLGIKQLSKDPWEDIRNRMRPGDTVSGKVVNVTDFGVFLELEEGIEGLIHVSELGTEKSKNPSEHFHPGDDLRVEILNIDIQERKIRLSLKALEDRADQEDIRQYAAGRGSSTVKIADLLGDHLRAARAAAADATTDKNEKEPKQPGEAPKPEPQQEVAEQTEQAEQAEQQAKENKQEPAPEPEKPVSENVNETPPEEDSK